MDLYGDVRNHPMDIRDPQAKGTSKRGGLGESLGPRTRYLYLIRYDVDFALGRLSQQCRHPATPCLEIDASRQLLNSTLERCEISRLLFKGRVSRPSEAK